MQTFVSLLTLMPPLYPVEKFIVDISHQILSFRVAQMHLPIIVATSFPNRGRNDAITSNIAFTILVHATFSKSQHVIIGRPEVQSKQMYLAHMQHCLNAFASSTHPQQLHS